jgi:hypothetical protein
VKTGASKTLMIADATDTAAAVARKRFTIASTSNDRDILGHRQQFAGKTVTRGRFEAI